MDETPNARDRVLPRIQAARRDLLDLSARNRLIHTPRTSLAGRKVEIVEERGDDVFRLLVRDRRALTFLPGAEEVDPAADQESGETETESDPAPDAALLPQPAEDLPSSRGGPDPRHVDLRLQTRLVSERLQKRLLDLSYDAQTYEQEQGVSILYLAVGFLRWFETPSSDRPREAPLLLVPVDLERTSAASRFTLRYREEDVATNLSLQEKLRAEFGVALPDVPEMDDLAPSSYCGEVALAVASQPRWEVLPDAMLLGFFSFAKYLMYRDLDPATWPAHAPLAANGTLSRLLGDGFAAEPPLCGDHDPIDPLIPAAAALHVTDADSSQAVVVEEVRRGRHLVVQGPPGTGKSQTITNLVASAIRDGKTVLFVAEKLAALEVVQHRLDRIGLGVACLPLHSNKASKKAILDDLARTLGLGRPRHDPSPRKITLLDQAIARLNHHAEIMNTPWEPSGLSPYEIVGKLALLRGRGVEPTSIALDDPETWTSDARDDRRRLVVDLGHHLQILGPPRDHPWRGVGRTNPLLPADFKALGEEVAMASEAISEAIASRDALAESLVLGDPGEATLANLVALARFAQIVVDAPAADRLAIAGEVWDVRRDALAELLQKGDRLREIRDSLDAKVSELAWQADLASTRRAMAAHGDSWFRWFHRDYREAVRTVKGLMKTPLPRDRRERLAMVDAILEAQGIARWVDDPSHAMPLGREAFGDVWRGSRSPWDRIAAIASWDARARETSWPWNHREVLARIEDPARCRSAIAEASSRSETAAARLRTINDRLLINTGDAFGAKTIDDVNMATLLDRMDAWSRNPEALSVWMVYERMRKRLDEANLAAIAVAVHDGRIVPDDVVDTFDAAYHQAMIREVFRRDQALGEFDGPTHDRQIDRFRDLDLARIVAARLEVTIAHHDAIPRAASGGEMKIVRREIEKKRRHMPIRKLLKEAGQAIQAIKPVFMMSPISVAQYLEPGGLTFDLLLIDEASQITPVDALGAMARARQVVVVGDDKQLPPTRFFNTMIDDPEGSSSTDDSLSAADLESILGLCVAQGMSQRMLRWHYRSRHHSLIAVSNREFYDNRLLVVPSPSATSQSQGLRFRHIPEGRFDRGNSAVNRVEARAIALAVVDHAASLPEKTLGVGAFSVSQRDAIRDELEVLLRERTDLAAFFATARAEPFFVKNLENIQGDERDVIFISVGYARDPSGSLSMNFGPLSTQGGERRLNVLITRARERCEVFSSITADEIDLERARSRGASAFKTFLRYAQTGVLDDASPTREHGGSDLETQVAHAVERLGYQVRRHVGAAGFVIDLAVVDPDDEGRYVLGIECDGETYNAPRSARDRDRIRHAVLRDRGWNLHRVWGLDWFHRPDEQAKTLAEAIEKARSTPREPPTKAANPSAETVFERLATIAEQDDHAAPDWVVPYQLAAIEPPGEESITETHPDLLAQAIVKIVEVEAPIHREELSRRVLATWGQQRSGARIAEAIDTAIALAITTGALREDDGFLTIAREGKVVVRNREAIEATGPKRPEMIAPDEYRAAISQLIDNLVGVRRDEVATLISRALGFKTTTGKLKETIEGHLDAMIADHRVVVRDDKLERA